MAFTYAGLINTQTWFDTFGKLLKNTALTLTAHGSMTLWNLYGASSRVPTLTQPLSTDADGNFALGNVYGDPGDVDVWRGTVYLGTFHIAPDVRDFVGGTGPPGPTLNDRGTYSGSTAYAAFDKVNWPTTGPQGSYYAKAAPPVGTDPTNATWWAKLADPGATGSAGAPAVNWRTPATIQPSTPYAVNDGLQDAGGSWRCILAYTTGLSPTVPSADPTHWASVATQGAQGAGINWRTDSLTILGSTPYAVNDGLQGTDGGTYRCILAYTSASTPIDPSADLTHWAYVAKPGTPGTPGAAGPPLPIVNAVATANVAALSGTTTVDGVALAAGQVVLLVNQATGSQNGPWTIAAGAWARPSWYGSGTSQIGVTVVAVPGGTQWGSTEWFLTNTSAVTVDTTATTWAVLPPAVVQGTHANRPTAAAWNRNLVYFETDTGLEWQNWSGSAWTQITSGTELAFASITTSPSSTSTTYADVAGLTITFVAPSRPIYLSAWALIDTLNADTNVQLQIVDPGGLVVSRGLFQLHGLSSTNNFPAVLLRARLPSGAYVITPGNSYTFKLQIASGTAGNTAAILGNSQWPAFLAAIAA